MEDFKEIVYFALSLIMASFIITLIIALGVNIGQSAEVRRGELEARQNLITSRRYIAYDNQKVTGAEIISLLRENAVAFKLQIYADKNINGTALTMNESNYTNAAWNYSQLKRNIKADAVYLAILVYGGGNPATATYTANPDGEVTGVRFTLL